MRIAICDDDVATLVSISDFITKTYRDIDLLTDLYSSGEDLLTAVEKKNKGYDLLLLDIEMKGIDGIQVAQKVHELLPEMYVAFTTSHEEFALTGYEVSAFRFLTKPIRPKKLLETISAVRNELLNQKTIHVESSDIEAVLKIKDILYIEAQDKNVKIVQRERPFYDRNGIDFYAQLLLSEDFYRIHRSYLINLGYIKFIDNQDVRMANGDIIPVSRLRKKQFAEVFQFYIKRTAR